jgi:hypothetical protein
MINVPDKIQCHGEMADCFNYQIAWRDPSMSEPYSYPFRTCSYCGSIHPGDLLKYLGEGAHLEGSDWKYGWPHKFYVRGIPNPLAGKQVAVGSESYPIYACSMCGEEKSGKDSRPSEPCGCCDAARWIVKRREDKKIMGDAPKETFAKFYNIHLADLDPDSVQILSQEMSRSSGIEFFMAGEKLRYRAPRHGYQAG